MTSTVFGQSPFLVFAVLLVAFAAVLWLRLSAKRRKYAGHIRGTKVATLKKARRLVAQVFSGMPRCLWVSGLVFPRSIEKGNFLFLGVPGTGKTTGINFLLQQWIPDIVPGSNKRAILFDAKTELLPFLKSPHLGATCPVTILHPFDRRCSVWNVARDVVDRTTARLVANHLVQPSSGSSSENEGYFLDTARVVLTALMESLMHNTKGKWTFSDLVFAARHPRRIESLLRSCPHTSDVLENHAQVDRTWLSVLSTLNSSIDHFSEVASIYRAVQETNPWFSFRDFARSESVLVLPYSAQRKATIQPLLQLFFQLAAKNILRDDQSRDAEKRTYAVLDELGDAGYLPDLSQLFSKGRSYGVCLALGFQSKGCLAKYPKEEAATILELCSTKTVMKVREETAHWAAKDVFGFEQYWEQSVSKSEKNASKQRSVQERSAVLPSMFQHLRDMEHSKTFEAYCQAPGVGSWHAAIAKDVVLSQVVAEADSSKCPPYLEHKRDKLSSRHLTWNSADLKRVGLSPSEAFVGVSATGEGPRKFFVER